MRPARTPVAPTPTIDVNDKVVAKIEFKDPLFMTEAERESVIHWLKYEAVQLKIHGDDYAGAYTAELRVDEC